MSPDLSEGARRVKNIGLKEAMPDIVQVERKHSRLDFKSLTTRRFQEFNEDLSKVGREAFGFLCHYGTLAPLLSRSERGRLVEMFCENFASDLMRLGRQAYEFMRFYATVLTPQENGFRVGQNFVCGFLLDLIGVFDQSVRFILLFVTLRFIRRNDCDKTAESGADKTREEEVEIMLSHFSSSPGKESPSPNTTASSRHPSHFASSSVSMKTTTDAEQASGARSASPKHISVESSQPGFSKAEEIPSLKKSSTEDSQDSGGRFSKLTSAPSETKNFVVGFLRDIYKLHKYSGNFLVSFLPSLQQLKTSALFQVVFAKDISALFVYVVRFIAYYLFYPYPLRLLRALKSMGGLRMALDAIKLTIKALTGLFSLFNTIIGVLFIARENEEVVDSKEQDEKAENTKSELVKDVPDIKLDPEDLKNIEFKPSKPAIKKLQQPKKEAPSPEPKVAKRVKIPPVSKTIDIEGAEFEHEMKEIAKSSAEIKSRTSGQEKGTQKDGSSEEDDSAKSRKKGWWRKKDTRDGTSQTAAMSEPPPPKSSSPPPKRRDKSFTDAGTDPAPPPQYVTEPDLISGRRNKSRHSSGAAGFYRFVQLEFSFNKGHLEVSISVI